ncbi:excinuclease ABC subunit UvrA [Mariniblastus sp.]|nr:excinuclease ABC subunit UvrA [Mariniblastus sp.]
MAKTIQLRNVRVNNLKEVSVEIPHGQWLSVCGLSGSGKSSLAFDTLYAEGQRRYIESLSPHTRQFMFQLDRPDADGIDGIPAAIAVRPSKGKFGKKTTLGTASEITEYLRLAYAKIGHLICPVCRLAVTSYNPQSVADSIASIESGVRFQIVYSVNPDVEVLESLGEAMRAGFSRAIVGDVVVELARADREVAQTESAKSVKIIVDRLKSGDTDESRLRESIELAFYCGSGNCEIWFETQWHPSLKKRLVDTRTWYANSYSRDSVCGGCARSFPRPEPRLFSFQNSVGACPECQGIGCTKDFPDQACATCNGLRLNEDALAFYVGDKNLGQLGDLTVDQTIDWLGQLSLTEFQRKSVGNLIAQVSARLNYLAQVGLGYLNLDRSLRSMSSGEVQRVSLTAALSSTLVDLLYVLDEPSLGLHAFDIDKLVEAIERLHQRNNTVVVVDHQPRVIESAERIIEIGPGAGQAGGEVVFDGTREALLESDASLTGQFLSGVRGVSSGAENRRSSRGRIKLVGACGNNLKNVHVEFPLGCLCVVTGVSGSGKSSLVRQTLYAALCDRKQKSVEDRLPYTEIFGDGHVDEVVLVDASPIGRTARSNPVTYVKAFDDIRRTFAETVDAKTRNIKMGQFSFNVSGGRCDKCEGAGQLVIDMQFLGDLSVVCDQCAGLRYRDEVLSVKYRGRSIAEVLNMTVREAFSFFRGQPKVQAKLKSLIDVGLDYICLGQPAPSLSSGEAQRLKLGHYLNASKSKRVLFVMEEPTTGLHMSDINRLLDCFGALLSVGHSMIVVEHNLSLIKNADWIIDLGPGAGDAGGQVVAEGTPEMVSKVLASKTGAYLQDELSSG